MATLEIKNLSFAYAGQEKNTLENINTLIDTAGFTLICGATGSGKTTLVRLLKRQLAPCGKLTGEILIDGRRIEELSDRESVSRIGYVGQDVDNQLVCDRVWHELSFTLEGLGEDSSLIRRRCAEVSGFFNIEELFERQTNTLSGGEKQSVCLAASLTAAPELLILDEPISQLDPVAASEFGAKLSRINRELGIGIVLCEHRLDGLVDLCDRLIMLDRGSVVWQGKPSELDRLPFPCPVEDNLPSAMGLYRRLKLLGIPPLNTVQGKRSFSHFKAVCAEEKSDFGDRETVLETKGLYFSYDKKKIILKDMNLKLYKGEHFAVLGGNGSGKSTLLYLIAGAYKPLMGKIKHNGSITLLPQNPANLFSRDTVSDEAGDSYFTELFGLDGSKNPLDLSGGQQQLLGFIKAVGKNSDILLLDEPTKALDGSLKVKLAEVIRSLNERGVTVLTVSHDTEFCAECAHRCGLLFNGSIVASDDARSFFKDNICYTTAVNKMLRGNAMTVGEAAENITEAD